MKKTNQFFLFLNYRQKSKRTNLGKVNSIITFFNDRKTLKGDQMYEKVSLIVCKNNESIFPIFLLLPEISEPSF